MFKFVGLMFIVIVAVVVIKVATVLGTAYIVLFWTVIAIIALITLVVKVKRR